MVKGWIYKGVNAIPVEVLGEFNSKTWRVRFLTRKMGWRGSVRAVAKGGVSLIAPGFGKRTA